MDKDPFIGPQEFVVGYSKAPEQPQNSARPISYVILTLWPAWDTNQPICFDIKMSLYDQNGD